jgi:hypothetical protein
MSNFDERAAGVPFGSNDVRLSLREWAVAVAIAGAVLYLAPRLWERAERFEPAPDARIPYSLGNDYWMFGRWSALACAERKDLVIGDSVVWGHYVRSDQTLSHHLNALAGRALFANLGVDGIHPAALSGLIEEYGGAISGRNVILHLNLLWTSSEKHDLQTTKEFSFNHPDLVPQFFPRIPCYRRSTSEKLDVVIGRQLPFAAWATHLRIAYFGGADIPSWTLEHPYADPLRRITLELPSPDEPPSPAPVAKPWTEQDLARFDAQWVDLGTSIQWRFFRRAVEILQRKRNRVFVLVGPFNEHMLTPGSLEVYNLRKDEVEAWLKGRDIPYFMPAALPSDQYADASHPLSEGYAMLARRLFESEAFRRFQGSVAVEEGSR